MVVTPTMDGGLGRGRVTRHETLRVPKNDELDDSLSHASHDFG